MNSFLRVCWLAMLCGSAFLRADAPEEDYVRIYNLIQLADTLAESGRNELARQKYSEAHSELDRVRTTYPGWNEKVVQFRMNYLIERLGLPKTPETPTGREPAEKAAMASSESAARIKQLLEQIRQLTADKELLQAKLKEALSAQPAALDPRELARSEEKVKTLQKDVEVLTVNLKKAEAKPDKPIDPSVFAQTKQGLAAANQKLAQQMEVVSSLTLERDALQRRLQMLADGTEKLETKTRTQEEQLADARRAAQTNADLVLVLQTALRKAQEEKDTPFVSGNQVPFDEKTLPIDTNLPGAQIEQNPLAKGESSLKRALVRDPNDGLRLSLLGAAKVRQHKYDEALDLLSQSAQLDPQNAETFLYLGVALAEKGLPKPAESALRRATQLAPESAEAHHNLAKVYASEQPPALELARLHYQKGLACGHATDPKLEQLLSTNMAGALRQGVESNKR